MKLKRLPEDFQVVELPAVSPRADGYYTYYRLTKSGIGTPEAVEAIRRRWNLSSKQIAYGGMKDRHAKTTQYLTIAEGPNRALNEDSFSLAPLGALPHPYGPRFFRGNRFQLILRDMSAQAAAQATQALEQTCQVGLPNYFDDQRFGSVGQSREFLAESWLKGDYERALWLALADPNALDRPGIRQEKEIVRACWGDWATAKQRLPKSHARSLVTYLVDHPTDFRGAGIRLNRTFRSLAFSAYQSHLWNVWHSALIERLAGNDRAFTMEFATAPLAIPTRLDPPEIREFADWNFPLPSARGTLPAGSAGDLISTILHERGMDWNQLRIKHMKDLFFSKGSRPARFVPENLTFETKPDDLYPGRSKLLLDFELGKGSYATIVVKRITRAPMPLEACDDSDPV